MPEYAEIKKMADVINECSLYSNLGYKIETYKPNSRVIADFHEQLDSPFSYIASTRGKELRIEFADVHSIHTATFTMGMTGMWIKWKAGSPHPNHARLCIYHSNSDSKLCLLDDRKFAVWKWRDFNESRGPDPVDEFDDFKERIENSYHKAIFQKPIYEVLLNQTYFNGVGNYLRSTILYHLGKNPMVTAKEYLEENPQLIDHVRMSCEFAYEASRSELEKWKYYKKGSSLKDSNGRTFWYDPRWDIKI